MCQFLDGDGLLEDDTEWYHIKFENNDDTNRIYPKTGFGSECSTSRWMMVAHKC